jgi:hypothetical protein
MSTTQLPIPFDPSTQPGTPNCWACEIVDLMADPFHLCSQECEGWLRARAPWLFRKQ